MANTSTQQRRRNLYPANCSECKVYVEKEQGYLFQNTKFRNSTGFHVKCEACHSGETAKKIRAEEKATKGKTLSIVFAKKWVASLKVEVATDEYGGWVNVTDNTKVLLGWVSFSEGFQEYPSEDWCQEQAKQLGGTFTDKAVNYIIDTLTPMIEATEALAKVEHSIANEVQNHDLGLMPVQKVFELNTDLESEVIKNALIRLRIQNKIELRTTKTGVARSLNIELVDFDGVKYGFLKYG